MMVAVLLLIVWWASKSSTPGPATPPFASGYVTLALAAAGLLLILAKFVRDVVMSLPTHRPTHPRVDTVSNALNAFGLAPPRRMSIRAERRLVDTDIAQSFDEVLDELVEVLNHCERTARGVPNE